MTLNWPVVWLSLRVAGAATVGALVVGLWLGWRVATREFTGRKAVLGALALLFATPVVILASLFLQTAVFQRQAVAAAGVFAALPLIVFGARRPFEQLNREYGNAARSLGCSEWRIFWRVILPLGWRPILAAAVVGFVRVWIEWCFGGEL
jgi:molybdate transport system permease protein